MKKDSRTTRVIALDGASTKHIERAMTDFHMKTLTTVHLESAMPKPSGSAPATSGTAGGATAAQQPAEPKK